MNFLLDTNAVSEWTKPQPNPGLVSWLNAVDEDRVFLSVVTLTELRYGIERMTAGKKRQRLEEWLASDLAGRFEGRVLSIDSSVADACSRLIARAERLGKPMQAMDAYLAASAEVHDLTLVTRNDSHFAAVTPSVLNPWS